MDDDHFNMQLRKFLKKVGINSQRAIETGVREALADGRLKGTETLHASVTLTVPEAGIDLVIDDDISLE